MKKLTFTLVLMAFAFGAVSQVAMQEAVQGGSSRFTHDFTCMPAYVFGQIPTDLNTGIYCDVIHTYSKVADDYTATGPFNTLKFWGHHVSQPVEPFLIEFYDGVPGQPGTSVIHSFNMNLTAVATGYISSSGFPVYEFDATFGATITQLNGWVSVSRTDYAATDPFTWTGLNGGGNSLSYDHYSSYWYNANHAPAFCLGTTGTIPISGWALFIGIGLILALAVLRFRKA